MTPEPASEAAVDGQDRPAAGAYLALVLLGLTYTLSFLDRQILTILAEPIKADLRLSDTEVGALTGFMFAIFYTTFGIPLAALADRSDRVRIIAVSCAVWSVFTAACGLATSFPQLALARMGVGIGEAGGTPPAFSLLSQLFPPARRAMALALYSLGSPIGIIAGGVAGGLIAERLGWRAAFVAVAAPGLLVAVLMRLMLSDPRERPDGAATPARSGLRETLAWSARNPLLLTVSVAAGMASFVGYGVMNWTPALLMRVKAMSLGAVGAYYSWAVGLSIGLGIWGGGYIVDRYGRASPRLYALAPAWALLAAAPPFIGALFAPSWAVALALITLPAALFLIYLAPTLALVQNMTPPHMRATASAILLLIVNLMGLGCGPLFVGVISDRLKPHFGATGLVAALSALLPFFLATSGLYFFVASRLGRRSADFPSARDGSPQETTA